MNRKIMATFVKHDFRVFGKKRVKIPAGKCEKSKMTKFHLKCKLRPFFRKTCFLSIFDKNVLEKLSR